LKNGKRKKNLKKLNQKNQEQKREKGANEPDIANDFGKFNIF